jgi:hypothetical protein
VLIRQVQKIIGFYKLNPQTITERHENAWISFAVYEENKENRLSELLLGLSSYWRLGRRLALLFFRHWWLWLSFLGLLRCLWCLLGLCLFWCS